MDQPAPSSLRNLAEAAVAVLSTPDPAEKARLSRFAGADFRSRLLPRGAAAPPDRPARPARPELLPPNKVPRRRVTEAARGRIALLHALAHIELNAIDLAWDMIARFDHADLPADFASDWLRVAEEEARHYDLLAARLAVLGAAYGDLPAHDGLWEAAHATRHDLLARLAVVPLVLEARGLDVTPGMIDRLEAVGDAASATILRIIYRDEIGHVATGLRWFGFVASARGLRVRDAWQAAVRAHFRGTLKPPFNEAARREAGLVPEDYEPLATE